MANKLDPMDLKQIITLHLNGYSNRKIGSALGISRNTVNTYMKRFKAREYSCKQLLWFDNTALTELFSSQTTLYTQRHYGLMKKFEKLKQDRNHTSKNY